MTGFRCSSSFFLIGQHDLAAGDVGVDGDLHALRAHVAEHLHDVGAEVVARGRGGADEVFAGIGALGTRQVPARSRVDLLVPLAHAVDVGDHVDRLAGDVLEGEAVLCGKRRGEWDGQASLLGHQLDGGIPFGHRMVGHDADVHAVALHVLDDVARCLHGGGEEQVIETGGDLRHQDEAVRRGEEAEVDGQRMATALGFQPLVQMAQLQDDVRGALAQDPAVAGEVEPLGLLVEQRAAQLLLERGDERAHLRLGHAQMLRRVLDGFAMRDLDELFELLFAHGSLPTCRCRRR